LDTLTTFLFVLYSLIVILWSLGAMVYYGSLANDAVWTHRGALSRVQLQLREQRGEAEAKFRVARRNSAVASSDATKLARQGSADVDPQTMREINVDTDAIIDSVIRMLEAEDETDPVTVVGLRASTQLMSTLFTVAFALFSAGVSLLSNASGGKSI
jgi:hypothetical protein